MKLSRREVLMRWLVVVNAAALGLPRFAYALTCLFDARMGWAYRLRSAWGGLWG